MRTALSLVCVLVACGGSQAPASSQPREPAARSESTTDSEARDNDEPTQGAMDDLISSDLQSMNAWPSTSGLHRLTRTIGGHETRVSVDLPDGYNTDTPRPLVVALHYGGEPTPHYGAGLLETIFIAGLAELDAILVAPDTLEGGWVSSPNQAMLPALFEELFETYAVDRSRVLLAGYSMGGMGTWEWAAAGELPITAAMPVSGTPGNSLPTIPTHAVHSDSDEVFELARVQGAIGYMQQAGTPAELTVLPNLGHFAVAEHVPGVQTAARWIAQQWNR